MDIGGGDYDALLRLSGSSAQTSARTVERFTRRMLPAPPSNGESGCIAEQLSWRIRVTPRAGSIAAVAALIRREALSIGNTQHTGFPRHSPVLTSGCSIVEASQNQTDMTSGESQYWDRPPQTKKTKLEYCIKVQINYARAETNYNSDVMSMRCSAIVLLVLFAMYLLSSVLYMHRDFNLEFGVLDPNLDAEILDYKYGTSTMYFTHADEGYVKSGHIPQATNIHANFPPGDVLYVKWRNIGSGKIYETTADLTHKLPYFMNGNTIHFSVNGAHLYVYMVEGGRAGGHIRHSTNAEDCPLRLYKMYRCKMLYPDEWSNY